MPAPDPRSHPATAADPLSYMAAAIMLMAVLVAVAYAFYLILGTSTGSAPATDLERDLAQARAACVAGPPQGPACVDAARITTELAQRQRGS